MDIGLKIKKLRKEKSLTQTTLARQIGIPQSQFSKIESGETKRPDTWIIQKLNNIFEIDLYSYNLDQIAPNAYNKKQNSPSILTVVVDNSNNEVIPVVPIYAHAGYLRGYSDPEFIRTLPISDGETFKDGTYRDFEVKGDSMEDKIFERDIVRAKFLDPSLYLNDKLTLGTLFVVVTPEKGIILKQVIDHDVIQGKITFHSFNHFHKDFSLHVSEIKEMWYYKQYTSARKFDQYR